MRRAPDLPHRSLSRQGDGAEHPGRPLRQRHRSSRSGTATISTTSRSPSPKPSASSSVASSTTRPARCATWCRTTCSSCSPLIAMEPPIRFDADAVRSEKAKVLRRDQAERRRGASQCRARAISARARSTASEVADLSPGSGRRARHRRPRPIVALKVAIDNWRWAGVPFYLRTGKALAASRHRDRDPVQAGAACAVPRHAGRRPAAERLIIAIQPDEGISLRLRRQGARAARCGSTASSMDFRYEDYFQTEPSHRLRDADLRLHDRRRDAVPARRHIEAGWRAGAARASTPGSSRRNVRCRSTTPAAQVPGRPMNC